MQFVKDFSNKNIFIKNKDLPLSIKVSDAIALFLKEKKIKHVFGIIGSANSHIFDSITTLGYTQIICVHHEQAATMAMQNYYRVSGKITAALLTAGGGSSNGITGVLSAWADSIPGIVISGQENTRFIRSMKNMRMWGVQGYDSSGMVKSITKYSVMVKNPKKAILELEKGYHISGTGRKGPVWIDYPIDIQGAKIDVKKIEKFTPNIKIIKNNTNEYKKLLKLICKAKRPVFWLGNGIRLSNAQNRIRNLLATLPIPSIVSWAGMDILDSNHVLNYGRAGVYGTRAGNLIIQNSDLVISIGNRMSILMIGYEQSEFARAAKIVQVDIDQTEIDKVKKITNLAIKTDAGEFIKNLTKLIKVNYSKIHLFSEWINICNGYKKRFPFIGPEHNESKGYINSYKFMDKLSNHLKAKQIIVTDTGTALLSGHQSLKLKNGQRLMTSTGLGEMGNGLPGAIGASFAKNKGEVMCLNCDGGMMMNLQELQTISHHNLPIKLFIFNNDGYLMIKHTQKNLFNGRKCATNRESGVSCPDFKKIAYAFNIPYCSISNWEDFNIEIPNVQKNSGPIICEIFMDPEQYFYPKQSVLVNENGQITSAPLEDMSPLLDRKSFNKEMIIPLHNKSKNLKYKSKKINLNDGM